MLHNQHRHQRGNHRVPADLKQATRNHYFYGKLLDVFHLELEQEYFNSKRWLLNRLVTGPGTVCGLKVELSDDGEGVIVLPGLAIDRCGHEIIVSRPSEPEPLPPLPDYESPKTGKGYQGSREYSKQRKRPDEERGYYCELPFAHVVLCYHECETDPLPAMAGDCETVALCASGSIREQYSVEVRDGFAPERQTSFPRNVIEGGEINSSALVDYIIGSCRAYPDECCLPLANVELRETDDGWKPEIDNSVRAIAYTNRLLFHLINSLVRKDEADASEV